MVCLSVTVCTAKVGLKTQINLALLSKAFHMSFHVFMDGGMVWNVNLDAAVQQCLKIVDDVSDIIVDIAVCDKIHNPGSDPKRGGFGNWQLGKAINDYYLSTDQIFQEVQAFPGIDIRYYFQLHNNTCPGSSLDFDNSTTWCLQEKGRQDA